MSSKKSLFLYHLPDSLLKKSSKEKTVYIMVEGGREIKLLI